MKQWAELNDIERYAIREYKSWCKSDCDELLKYEMAMFWITRITELNLLHLIQ
jgi:hypothetical protein